MLQIGQFAGGGDTQSSGFIAAYDLATGKFDGLLDCSRAPGNTISASQFEADRVKSWSEDPWQRGGLTSFGPGELNWIPVNARREGRISFAGEHTSRWNGWMQGAIESARRVAKEISA